MLIGKYLELTIFFKVGDLTKRFAYNSFRWTSFSLIVWCTSVDVSTKGVPDPQFLGQSVVHLKVSTGIDWGEVPITFDGNLCDIYRTRTDGGQYLDIR